MRLIFLFIILVINALFAGEIITTNDFAIIAKEADKLDGNSLLLSKI